MCNNKARSIAKKMDRLNRILRIYSVDMRDVLVFKQTHGKTNSDCDDGGISAALNAVVDPIRSSPA